MSLTKTIGKLIQEVSEEKREKQKVKLMKPDISFTITKGPIIKTYANALDVWRWLESRNLKLAKEFRAKQIEAEIEAENR